MICEPKTYNWYATINNIRVYVDAVATEKNEEVDEWYKNLDYIGQHTIKAVEIDAIQENVHCYVYRNKNLILKDINLYGCYCNIQRLG